MGGPQRRDDDWLDCMSPAWQQGYADGYEGREADPILDGHRQPAPAERNSCDGFVTGQTERQHETE